MRIFKRIANRLKRAWTLFQRDAEWSVLYALMCLLVKISKRIGSSKLTAWLTEQVDQYILSRLSDQLRCVFAHFRDDQSPGEYQEDAPVWVCWWTGLENAPELVKRCIQSIQQNAGQHPVHVISKDNYSHFISIPQYMLDKVQTGNLGLAHFSDYIRVKLIAEHGGLWLDATIFCTGNISQLCFDLPIFTSKGPVQEGEFISQHRWTGFCLGGWKGNVFYQMLAMALECYWNNNQHAITYLFFDYIILLIYENNETVTSLMDRVPENNIHRHTLQSALTNNVSIARIHEFLYPDTVLHKLSWKGNYAMWSSDGSPTVYLALLDGTFS